MNKKKIKTQTENTGRKQNVCMYVVYLQREAVHIFRLSSYQTVIPVQIIINRTVCFAGS